MTVRLEAGCAPKGNWVARNLRLLNDDSKELFPKTPAEAKLGRFDSMYTKDYHQFPTEVFLEGLAPKGQQPERESIRDVLFGQSPTSTFTNWRIPKRISGECEPARIGDHIGKAASEKPATNALLRQSTLPVIPLRNRRTEFTPKPQLSASDIRQTPLQLHRSKTTMDQPTTRSLDVGSPLKAQLGQWQQRLPDVDPNLLHKVLRLQDQQDAASSGKAARGALLPDARRTVERWMETASEPERQVAMRFFGSLAGGRLMGMDGEQNKRLKDVMDVLQGCCQSRYVAENGLSPRTFPDQQLGEGQDSPRLRHVRLLDEDTRRQRWMHTTWHHLPNYRLLNPVTNSSSHYVTPHKGQHRHFVIHPDWPPV